MIKRPNKDFNIYYNEGRGYMVKTLCDLEIGKKGKITKINLEENLQRKLLNFGVYEGQIITCVLESPFKDPRAYEVCKTTFSLRNADALLIEVDLDE